MTLKKQLLQARLFDLDDLGELEDEKGNQISPEEAQRISEAARAAFAARSGDNPDEDGVPAWMDDYLALLRQGWKWRVAAYIAWAASPKIGRWPETQEQLAVEVLGLTSDRQIHTWRSRNPSIDEVVGALQVSQLFEHRGDVLNALITSASNPDYKSHQDRKLYLEMIGDHVPQAQLRQLLLSGKLKLKKGKGDYEEAELEQIAGLVGADMVDLLFDDDNHIASGDVILENPQDSPRMDKEYFEGEVE